MGKIAFTASRVAAFNCPPNKSQAFLWDATTPGLGLRNTPKGQAAYVFQGVFGGKDLRITIGSPRAWSIPDAQSKAREYQRLIDQGLDPREQRRQRLAEDAAAKAASLAQAVVGLDVWDEYVKERKPQWGSRHYEDHLSMVKEGGLPSKNRRRQLTVEGPLRGLLQTRLIELKSEQVEEWARKQAAERPTYARLSWRCLKAFLNWCAEHPAYATLLPANNPAKTKKIREVLGKPNVKKDALQKEQLPAWFQAVQQLPNPVVSAYLQILLLTGARPGEVQDLEWANVDFAWNALTISDKVEGERKIPLTPYVRSLLEALPQRNRWVFASPRTDGPLSRLDTMHNTACKTAGIQGLTLHGLRRSFKSLTEWLDIPAGVVAQLMGHKPSATAEKYYTVRPLDLLRVHHTRIEAWILEQAGLKKDSPHGDAGSDSPE